MQAETHYHFRYMPRDKNIIQLTQSQLDRFARNVGYAIAKEIINGETKPDDDRVYNITQKGAARQTYRTPYLLLRARFKTIYKEVK